MWRHPCGRTSAIAGRLSCACLHGVAGTPHNGIGSTSSHGRPAWIRQCLPASCATCTIFTPWLTFAYGDLRFSSPSYIPRATVVPAESDTRTVTGLGSLAVNPVVGRPSSKVALSFFVAFESLTPPSSTSFVRHPRLSIALRSFPPVNVVLESSYQPFEQPLGLYGFRSCLGFLPRVLSRLHCHCRRSSLRNRRLNSYRSEASPEPFDGGLVLD